MSHAFLDFELPIHKLEEQIASLSELSDAKAAQSQIKKLRASSSKLFEKIYSNLTIWQKVQVARHPSRPHTRDYIGKLFVEFDQLHGDRRQGDDLAIMGGIARLDNQPVMVIGHEKGRETRDRIARNFGMAHPEGFRKAHRLMLLAERYRMPIVSFIDTTGAYPGIEAEERGQSESIAANLALLSKLRTPVVVVVIGEGGSGGALAIGVGDRVAMMEYAIYSVASPEACASIIWRDSTKADLAATAMKVDAQSLSDYGLIDAVLPEPIGGAHRDYDAAASTVGRYLRSTLDELKKMDLDDMVQRRYERIMQFGALQDMDA
ncbi:MAG: acetyl-CoA carboxylase carboxyltransferase subunit alpha [Gammaproteobacteria bacterium]